MLRLQSEAFRILRRIAVFIFLGLLVSLVLYFPQARLQFLEKIASVDMSYDHAEAPKIMWKEIKVKLPSRILKTEFEHTALQRSDGFTIIRTGVGREKQEEFLCKGSFGKFAFYAYRFDADGVKPFDYYTVITTLVPNRTDLNSDLDRNINRALILKHAKDVESALLEFPPIFDYQPVTKVWFDLNISNKPVKRVLADDLV